MHTVAIFDVDGTLVDSNSLHAESWQEAFAAGGIDLPFDVILKAIGKGGDLLIPDLTGEPADGVFGRRVSETRTHIFERDKLHRVRAFAGARQLLEALKHDGYVLATATSAKRHELDGLLQAGALTDIFDVVTTADDVEFSKPFPDVVCAALAKSGADTSSAFMVGDAPYDVAAARQAGVPIVGLRCGGWSDRELAGACALFDDPAAFLAAWRRPILRFFADNLDAEV